MSGSTNRIVFLSTVREHKRHKGMNLTRISIKGKGVDKECEVKLGRKWTKIQAKLASDDSMPGKKWA